MFFKSLQQISQHQEHFIQMLNEPVQEAGGQGGGGGSGGIEAGKWSYELHSSNASRKKKL